MKFLFDGARGGEYALDLYGLCYYVDYELDVHDPQFFHWASDAIGDEQFWTALRDYCRPLIGTQTDRKSLSTVEDLVKARLLELYQKREELVSCSGDDSPFAPKNRSRLSGLAAADRACR
jgi:hypothetical protein